MNWLNPEDEKGSTPEAVSHIDSMAAQYGLTVQARTRIVQVTDMYVAGIIRINNWFGGRSVIAGEFFSNQMYDADAKMRQYASEVNPPKVRVFNAPSVA